MSVTITYNNLNVFSGQPTPFIARSKDNVSYGERWASLEKISLIGQLTGCSFSELSGSQISLISGFSRDFQTLRIIQTGNIIQTFTNVWVDSIDFPPSNYVKFIPYQINLSCYPSGSFSGINGVIEPSDTWNYSQGENGLVEVSHQVSAKGIHTVTGGYGALDNARNFVLARTGFINYIAPNFISNLGTSGVLRSQSEVIDRFDSTYSITETFTLDQFFPCDYGILRYTIDQGMTQAGFNSASIKGSFEGSFNADFSLIKNRASNFDYYSSLFNGINSGIKLNRTPLNRKITENQNLNRIDFDISFDDNPSFPVNTVYNVNIQSGADLISVSVNGEVNGRGDLNDRWQLVKSGYSGLDIFSIANREYTGYIGHIGNSPSTKLNKNFSSESVSFDSFNGTISFDFTYQDKALSPSPDLLDFNYEVNVVPPLRKIIATPLISSYEEGESKYEITDMGFDSLGTISINGTSIPQRQISGSIAERATKNALLGVFRNFNTGMKNIHLEQFDIGMSNDESFRFSSRTVFDHERKFIKEPNYARLDFLFDS